MNKPIYVGMCKGGPNDGRQLASPKRQHPVNTVNGQDESLIETGQYFFHPRPQPEGGIWRWVPNKGPA